MNRILKALERLELVDNVVVALLWIYCLVQN